jgi:putative metallopeptidase
VKKANKNDIAPRAGDKTVSLPSLIPAELAEPGDKFIACPKTLEWIRATFLNQDSPLYNVEHDHLNSANIGVLWTNAENSRHMRTIVGTAELCMPPGSLNKWGKARWWNQIEDWFGTRVLDFIITLYAPYLAGASEIEQFAVPDHELYHCGQKRDAFGLPMFKKTTGKPVFGLRGHDVEEFVGIYRRYGYQAGAGDSIALVEAARRQPEIGAAKIAGMCGTCQ